MMGLVGDRLERRKILQHLIELTAYALPILCYEARNAAGRYDTNYQDNAVQKPSDGIHDRLAKLHISYIHTRIVP